MTTLPTVIIIIGSIIFFILGGFVGVIVMALMSIAKEADRHIEGEEEKKNERKNDNVQNLMD